MSEKKVQESEPLAQESKPIAQEPGLPAQEPEPPDQKPAVRRVSWFQSIMQPIAKLIKEKPAARNLAIVISAICIPLSLVVVWIAWFKLLPPLWTWSFGTLGFKFILNYIIGFFAVIVLAALPVYAPVGAFLMFAKVLSLYAEIETEELDQALDRDDREQTYAENELKEDLVGRLKDNSGLVSLLRYSRVQMKAYYKIGLTQTQRSFRYSLIAMWIGFTVILLGILLQVVDVELLSKIGIRRLETNVTALVILSGAIIEVISAFFLWVYRTSIKQLNYFYNRQMYNHSVLMCHRISETMKEEDSKDTKKAIVEKILDKTWALEIDKLPTGEKLLSFGSKKK